MQSRGQFRLTLSLWRFDFLPRRRGKGSWFFLPLFLLAAALNGRAEQKVIILTPHVDAIRHEFGWAFSRWHARKFGEKAVVEWRTIGGTSDALRFIQSEFAHKPEGIGLDIL